MNLRPSPITTSATASPINTGISQSMVHSNSLSRVDLRFVAQPEGSNNGGVTSRGGVESFGHALNTRTAGQPLSGGRHSSRSRLLQDGLPPGAEGPQVSGRPGPRDTVSPKATAAGSPEPSPALAACGRIPMDRLPGIRPLFPHAIEGDSNAVVRAVRFVKRVGGVRLSCPYKNRSRPLDPQKCAAINCRGGQKIAPLFTRPSPAPFGPTKPQNAGLLKPAKRVQASASCGFAGTHPLKPSSRSSDCSIEFAGASPACCPETFETWAAPANQGGGHGAVARVSNAANILLKNLDRPAQAGPSRGGRSPDQIPAGGYPAHSRGRREVRASDLVIGGGPNNFRIAA